MLVKDLTTDELKNLIKESIYEKELILIKEKKYLTPDEMLNLAKEIYEDLSPEEIAEIESITLSRFTL